MQGGCGFASPSMPSVAASTPSVHRLPQPAPPLQQQAGTAVCVPAGSSLCAEQVAGIQAGLSQHQPPGFLGMQQVQELPIDKACAIWRAHVQKLTCLLQLTGAVAARSGSNGGADAATAAARGVQQAAAQQVDGTLKSLVWLMLSMQQGPPGQWSQLMELDMAQLVQMGAPPPAAHWDAAVAAAQPSRQQLAQACSWLQHYCGAWAQLQQERQQLMHGLQLGGSCDWMLAAAAAAEDAVSPAAAGGACRAAYAAHQQQRGVLVAMRECSLRQQLLLQEASRQLLQELLVPMQSAALVVAAWPRIPDAFEVLAAMQRAADG